MERRKSDTLRTVMVIGGFVLAGKLFAEFFPPSPVDTGTDYQGPPLDQQPTLSLQRMSMLADRLEAALIGNPWIEDEDAATSALLECRNDADVVGLISVYGRRKPPIYVDPFAVAMTLPQAVSYYYDADDIEDLNSGLLVRGIQYTF